MAGAHACQSVLFTEGSRPRAFRARSGTQEPDFKLLVDEEVVKAVGDGVNAVQGGRRKVGEAE